MIVKDCLIMMIKVFFTIVKKTIYCHTNKVRVIYRQPTIICLETAYCCAQTKSRRCCRLAPVTYVNLDSYYICPTVCHIYEASISVVQLLSTLIESKFLEDYLVIYKYSMDYQSTAVQSTLRNKRDTISVPKLYRILCVERVSRGEYVGLYTYDMCLL